MEIVLIDLWVCGVNSGDTSVTTVLGDTYDHESSGEGYTCYGLRILCNWSSELNHWDFLTPELNFST